MVKLSILSKVLTLVAAMHVSSANAPFNRPSGLSAIPRGGAGPLDPSAVAKVFGTACLIQGTIIAFTSILAYSALNDSPLFRTALKVNAVHSTVGALLCLVSPLLGIKLWEVNGDDELSPGYLSICGAMLGKTSTTTDHSDRMKHWYY